MVLHHPKPTLMSYEVIPIVYQDLRVSIDLIHVSYSHSFSSVRVLTPKSGRSHQYMHPDFLPPDTIVDPYPVTTVESFAERIRTMAGGAPAAESILWITVDDKNYLVCVPGYTLNYRHILFDEDMVDEPVIRDEIVILDRDEDCSTMAPMAEIEAYQESEDDAIDLKNFPFLPGDTEGFGGSDF